MSIPRLSFVGLFATALACDGAVAPRGPAVATITLTPSENTACQGDTVRFQATARETDGQPIPGVALTWSSSQPAVATVDQSGLVHALDGGLALIRATHGAIHGEVRFIVRAPSVTFGYKYPSLFVGDTTLVTATVLDLNDLVAPEAPALWVSHTQAVATISSAAVVTGHETGVAEIAAQGACGVQGTVNVAVLEPRSGIEREVTYIADTLRGDGLFIDQAKTVLGNGTAIRVISVPGEFVSELAWARDGSRVVLSYASLNGVGRSSSYTANPDGSGETPLGAYLWSPDWSPDGTRIAYRNYISSGESDVYSMRADGLDVRQLTSAPGDDLEPKWSPDGRQVLYTRHSGPTPELWVVAADSADRRRIPLSTGALNPRWSPDGKYIAFDNGVGVWIVNADGTKPRALSSNCSSDGTCSSSETYRYASWAPNGQRIAYARYEPTNAVVIVNADGTGANAIPVTGSCCWPLAPEWSPDGRRVVFAGTKPTSPSWPAVALMGADGTGVEWVSGDENARRPTWRP